MLNTDAITQDACEELAGKMDTMGDKISATKFMSGQCYYFTERKLDLEEDTGAVFFRNVCMLGKCLYPHLLMRGNRRKD